MATEEFKIIAKIKDFMSGTFKKAGRQAVVSFKAMTGAMKKFGRAAKRVFAGVRLTVIKTFGLMRRSLFNFRTALLAVFAGAYTLRAFAKFEQGIAEVSTLVDTTKVSMEDFGEGVKSISMEMGESIEALTAGLYDLISGGVDAADAVDTLRVASELAVGGATDTASAIKGLLSIMNAYGLEASEAGAVSDSMFKAMEGGRTTIEELSEVLGRVAPIANLAGLSFDEVNATLAAMTKGGLKTDEAVTSLRQGIKSLLFPTNDSAKAAKGMGIELSAASLSAKGFTQFMYDLAEASGKHPLGAATALGQLFPNIRAFSGMAIIAKDQARLLHGEMDRIADKDGARASAVAKMEKTLSHHLKQLWATFQVTMINVGEAMSPWIIELSDNLRDWLKSVGTARNQIREVVNTVFGVMQQTVTLFKTAWQQGEMLTFLTNIIVNLIDTMVSVLLAGIPLLTSALTRIGQEVAQAFVRAFIGETQTELAAAVTGGGVIAGLLDVADFVGVMGPSFGEWKKNLLEVNSEMEATEKLLVAMQSQQERLWVADDMREWSVAMGDAKTDAAEFKKAVIAISTEGLSAFENLSITGGKDLLPEQLNKIFRKRVVTFEEVNKALLDLRERQENIVFGGTGKGAEEMAAVRAAARTEYDAELAAWLEQTKLIMKEGGEKLGKGMSDPFQAELDRMLALLAGFSERLGQAAVRDMPSFLEDARSRGYGQTVDVGMMGRGDQVGPTREAAKGMEELGAATEETTGIVKRFTEGWKQMSAGIDTGMKNFKDTWFDFQKAGTQAIDTLLTGGFNKLEDAFVNIATGAMSAKEAFAQFALQMLADLARILIRMAMIAALNALFPGFGAAAGLTQTPTGKAKGGMTGPLFPIKQYAAGGVTTGPTLAMVGEGRNREAVVPLPDNRSIPVRFENQEGAGISAGEQHNHYHMHFIDTRDAQRFLQENHRTIAAIGVNAASTNQKYRDAHRLSK